MRFGIREVTYELSALDAARARPALRALAPRPRRQAGDRQAPRGAAPDAARLGADPRARAAETSPAVRFLDDADDRALPRDQGQRPARRVQGRQLGPRRGDEARVARAARALLPAGARRQPHHDPQLVRPEHRGGLLRPGRRVRPHGLERLLDLDAELEPPAGRPRRCCSRTPRTRSSASATIPRS